MRDRLVPLLEAHLREFSGDFAWGETDCMRSAALWVQRATGKELAPYPRYSSARSAAAILKRRGFADVTELVSFYLPERPVTYARIGDLVCAVGDDGASVIGICTGLKAAFLVPQSGFILYPLTICVRAWTVE